MKKYYSIAVCLCFTMISIAQTFEIRANKNLLVIGEQTELQLRLSAANGSLMQLPIFNDTVANHIEVVSASKIDTVSSDTSITLSQTLVITSFDSGYYAVSPRAAFVNNDTVWSNAFLIAVETMNVDTNSQYYDIKNAAELPISFKELLREYWPWLAGFVALIAGITIIVYRLSKGKKIVELIEKTRPKIPAHVAAAQKLAELRAKQLWQNGKTKSYYSELTEILRWYIEQRFGIPALEQTTDETKDSLRRMREIEDDFKEKIYRLLFLADLVKFAKENPVGSENEVHFENVSLFIEHYALKIENQKENAD